MMRFFQSIQMKMLNSTRLQLFKGIQEWTWRGSGGPFYLPVYQKRDISRGQRITPYGQIKDKKVIIHQITDGRCIACDEMELKRRTIDGWER